MEQLATLKQGKLRHHELCWSEELGGRLIRQTVKV